jgi:hypothetical protein
MAKGKGECFLCGQEDRGKRFTFYSGVRKGGSRTELITVTVTVLEWWKDLQVHDVHVCRVCQERLWRERPNWQPVLWGAGGAVLLLLAVPVAVFGGLVGLGVAAVLVVAALAAGAAGVWLHVQGAKPQRGQMDPLVVRAAMAHLLDHGRTYVTSEVYQDLVERGIIE